ncbi:MAG TPA: hypothetical protein DCQ26_04685 [Marinilabiliales bacterium]|nr:MAG: hypothetical protein A2W95_10675 [Bacteroidetes bacterium GWA2_40_14]OFX93619.1 MAG: hypothetical protein A2W97_07790 [Bacteroidetes bacterium GWE2_40_63]OFZ28276.1 MAG: hypothetical protein A2437_00025 [Bacteroidetes bacterium RIFOXYC2_FULL_40_12]HAM97886.1 hypothetical protein [Marinilabiliales bacterium]HAZ04235.1 hypothetical protein [Marinilabiliales bacterium]
MKDKCYKSNLQKDESFGVDQINSQIENEIFLKKLKQQRDILKFFLNMKEAQASQKPDNSLDNPENQVVHN